MASRAMLVGVTPQYAPFTRGGWAVKLLVGAGVLTHVCSSRVAVADQDQDAFSLTGEVRGCVTKSPAADARVDLRGESDHRIKEVTVTDKAGRFVFDLLDPGVYTVRVEYDHETMTVPEWNFNGRTPLIVDLGEIKLKGKIVAPRGSGFKLPTAVVKSVDGRYEAIAHVSDTGEFHLESVPATKLKVTVDVIFGSRIAMKTTTVDLSATAKDAVVSRTFDAPEVTVAAPSGAPASRPGKR